jgi:hypothetical protein
MINVRENGRRKNIYIHAAVAKAFIENDDPEHKTDVSHLDETRDNNRADNLVWATKKENCNMPLFRERSKEAHG